MCLYKWRGAVLNGAVRGRQNGDTLWRQNSWRVHVTQMLTRFVTRAKFVSWTQKKCFWKPSETFLVSARRATMLPRFATNGQHRRTHCCRHSVSSSCQGFMGVKWQDAAWRDCYSSRACRSLRFLVAVRTHCRFLPLLRSVLVLALEPVPPTAVAQRTSADKTGVRPAGKFRTWSRTLPATPLLSTKEQRYKR